MLLHNSTQPHNARPIAQAFGLWFHITLGRHSCVIEPRGSPCKGVRPTLLYINQHKPCEI
ncbi:hypothetical protein HanIR_Chr04g0160251 [Helianthus annuus]|uniref:Uncharacterized protein n=1 Tax=Helianthus annuus TaxID=4232 RepID=A0A251UZ43_HELAN|nr:hypothetical protein HanIR_Chr04g0160251 [Helianthus annuus]